MFLKLSYTLGSSTEIVKPKGVLATWLFISSLGTYFLSRYTLMVEEEVACSEGIESSLITAPKDSNI